MPATGTWGVGTAAISHEQSVSSVHDGLRHEPSIQTRSDIQSVLMTHDTLQLAREISVGDGVSVLVGVTDGVPVGVLVGVGVFVGVSVPVGVLVGVAVIVPVGVTVGVVIENVSVQAGSTALGVACGTVGATGLVVVSRWVVRNVIIPSPRVMKKIMTRYQYLRKNIESFTATDGCRILRLLL